MRGLMTAFVSNNRSYWVSAVYCGRYQPSGVKLVAVADSLTYIFIPKVAWRAAQLIKRSSSTSQ
jgi:hypothetical protein